MPAPQTASLRFPLAYLSGVHRSFGSVAAHALLIGLLCSLPHAVAMWKDGGQYSPFSVSPSVSALTFDETHAYAPPARSFMSTGKIPAETDNYERRDMSAGIPFIPAAILGAMGWLSGSLEWAFIAADFIFPSLLFVLLYRLTVASVPQRDFRLLVAWTSVVIPFGLLNSIWLGNDAAVAPLEITRTPQPEISFLALLVAVALLARTIEAPSWRFTIAAGIASGAVVYCYYFYALAWGITLGFLFLMGLAWRLRSLWRQTAWTLVAMMLLAIPYSRATLLGKREGGQTFLLERMGAYTHRPNLLPLIAAILITGALFLFGKELCRKEPVYFALTAVIAGSMYGMNFQILSGYETQTWHFWKRLAVPVLFFLLASALAARAARAGPRNLQRLAIAARILLVILILETAGRLTRAGILVAPFERSTNPDIALLSWVRSHILPGQVIGTANPELILLIPALTSDYTYVPSGLRSLTSTGEIVNRYFELACRLEMSPADVSRAAALPNHLGHSTELLHVLGLSYTGDPAVYSRFVNDYESYARDCHDPGWRLDYLVIPASSNQLVPAVRFPFARVIYRNSGYELLDLHAGRTDAKKTG